MLLLDKEPLNVMSEEKKTKISKPKISQLIRIIFIPFLLAFTLRYIPHAFLGNIKVYPEAIPISAIDDFLSEENIINSKFNKTRKKIFHSQGSRNGHRPSLSGVHLFRNFAFRRTESRKIICPP